MTIHPHDTDRILGVLGEAIGKLRAEADQYTWESHPVPDLLRDTANDLALLHGAVSAERDQAERDIVELVGGTTNLVGGGGVVMEDTTRRAYLRLIKDEEISDEVMRGEHRDD